MHKREASMHLLTDYSLNGIDFFVGSRYNSIDILAGMRLPQAANSFIYRILGYRRRSCT